MTEFLAYIRKMNRITIPEEVIAITGWKEGDLILIKAEKAFVAKEEDEE